MFWTTLNPNINGAVAESKSEGLLWVNRVDLTMSVTRPVNLQLPTNWYASSNGKMCQLLSETLAESCPRCLALSHCKTRHFYRFKAWSSGGMTVKD